MLACCLNLSYSDPEIVQSQLRKKVLKVVIMICNQLRIRRQEVNQMVKHFLHNLTPLQGPDWII